MAPVCCVCGCGVCAGAARPHIAAMRGARSAQHGKHTRRRPRGSRAGSGGRIWGARVPLSGADRVRWIMDTANCVVRAAAAPWVRVLRSCGARRWLASAWDRFAFEYTCIIKTFSPRLTTPTRRARGRRGRRAPARARARARRGATESRRPRSAGYESGSRANLGSRNRRNAEPDSRYGPYGVPRGEPVRMSEPDTDPPRARPARRRARRRVVPPAGRLPFCAGRLSPGPSTHEHAQALPSANTMSIFCTPREVRREILRDLAARPRSRIDPPPRFPPSSPFPMALSRLHPSPTQCPLSLDLGLNLGRLRGSRCPRRLRLLLCRGLNCRSRLRGRRRQPPLRYARSEGGVSRRHLD